MSEHKVWIGQELAGGRVCCIKNKSVGVETQSGITYYSLEEIAEMVK